MFTVAVFCGGPSLERGISLNSARSLLDHLTSAQINVLPIYVDFNKNFYQLSSAQLYSNTPADFDFKLQHTATALTNEQLHALLKTIDIVFPAIHGSFGEDGELQSLLEEMDIPFVGSGSASCAQMFFKHRANDILMENGYAVVPAQLLTSQDENPQKTIEHFFHKHKLNRAIVKPSAGGSSIGVFSVATPQEAYQKTQFLFEQNIDRFVLLERFCTGREFTVLVFENHIGEPVALIPTEIEISYENNDIFDYRRKYLPTANTIYHTPPRFSSEVISNIQKQAESLFKLFNMRDFARLDGWLYDNGQIYFSDFNPITGLEQNSFIFRQASLLGLSHREALHYVLQRACERNQISFPVTVTPPEANKKNVFVIFGGKTAERQVSLMSGTNVWLKLRPSSQYLPTPFLLDKENNFWQLPYPYTLNHTVEEIYDNCLTSIAHTTKTEDLVQKINARLSLSLDLENILQQPQKMSQENFVQYAKTQQALIFIALHGGEGEDGTLQQYFSEHGLAYNGSQAKASSLCMDKYLTAEAISTLSCSDIISLPKKTLIINKASLPVTTDYTDMWQKLTLDTKFDRFIIKPRSDGCSTGIVLLQSAAELTQYTSFMAQGATHIPPHTFNNQSMIIELPTSTTEFLLEPYIETDSIVIDQHQLIHHQNGGWVELTVGVIEVNDNYHAMNPSITVAEGAVLSLEEKFQGGTGVNITPPPTEIISAAQLAKIKELIENVAKTLGIKNYARIDIFYNRNTDKMIVIEANTLPGLTPSTVIYHQALAETPPLSPQQFLELLIKNAS